MLPGLTSPDLTTLVIKELPTVASHILIIKELSTVASRILIIKERLRRQLHAARAYISSCHNSDHHELLMVASQL